MNFYMLVFSKIREWEKDYLDTQIGKIYQAQILGVADYRSKASIV